MVIDVADNSRMHQLPGLHSLFNLPLNMNLKGGNALKIEREIEPLSRTQPWIDTSRLATPEDLKLAADRIEFFNFEPPPEIRAYTNSTWHAVPGGTALVCPRVSGFPSTRICSTRGIFSFPRHTTAQDRWGAPRAWPRRLPQPTVLLPFIVPTRAGWLSARLAGGTA